MKFPECQMCELRGYSKEFCKLHIRNLSKQNAKQQECKRMDQIECKYKNIGKKAAYGAGIGAVTIAAGTAVAPVLGIKALIGHLFVAKATAGGGVVGAGINVARKDKKKAQQKKVRKKSMVIPFC
uniref:Magnetosome protein Mad7 n=1 Tax=Candidatus Magnetananas rongchengensis TaxID=1463558 RepID=A0A3Q8B7J8_9BACT|nr:magnetosome protein Mad7 [Candidatus Magnetananas rongchenensis]